MVAIIKDKKRFLSKQVLLCSAVDNHSLVHMKEKDNGKFVFNGPTEGAKFNIICGCASDRGSTVATPLVGICAGGDT